MRLLGEIRRLGFRLQGRAIATEIALTVSFSHMHSRADDTTLVRDALALKAGAFERIVSAQQRLVWYVVQSIVRDTEDSRELCQEVFLRVHQCLHQFRGESSLASWIGRIATNVALRHLEKKRIPLVDDDDGALMDAVPSDDDVLAELEAAQVNACLLQAIENLPPLQRLVLTLYHLEEMQISDVAAISGLAEGTIKSHLHRSRAKLRVQLAVQFGESNI